VSGKAATANHAVGVAWFVVRAGRAGEGERDGNGHQKSRERRGRRGRWSSENEEKAVAEWEKGQVDYGAGRAAEMESP
jgi:hypothetical protein